MNENNSKVLAFQQLANKISDYTALCLKDSNYIDFCKVNKTHDQSSQNQQLENQPAISEIPLDQLIITPISFDI